MAGGVDTSRLIIAADSTQIRTATTDLAALAAQGGRTATATGGLERSFAKVIGMVGGIATVTAAMKAATSASLEFSTAMGRVSTVIGSMGDMDAMNRGLKQMAATMGGSAASQAAAMYDILSAGISNTAQALDMLAASNKLAVGGVTSVGVAADGLTTIMMAYGDQVRSTQDASDAMFVSAAVGKTTIEQLSNTVGRVIPIAANAGVSLDELLASIGALTKGGINTHQSVDGLRAMLAAIIKPTDDSAKMAKKLGLEFNLAALQTKGWIGFIDDLAAKTKGNTAQMAKLMGGIESIVPAMALTGSGLKDLHDAMDRMAKKAGETEVAFEKMASTPQFKIDQLKAKISNMMVETGDKLVAWLAPMSEFGTKHFDQIISAAGHLKTALEILIAGQFGAWIGRMVTSLQTKANQMIINRAHTIALAEDEVRGTAIVMRATQADLQKVIAKGAVNSSYIAQIGFEKQLRAAITNTAAATALHDAANQRLIASTSTLTMVKKGLSSVVGALGGPFGVATIAIMAMVWAVNKLNDADADLRESMKKTAAASADSAGKTTGVMTTLKESYGVMGKAKKGSDEYENAQRKIEIATKSLMAIGPEYRDVLGKEADSYDKIAKAIEGVNRQKLAKLQADKLELQAAIDKKGEELSTWQKVKAAGAGAAITGLGVVGNNANIALSGKTMAKQTAAGYAAENLTRDQKAMNDLLAVEVILQNALLPIVEKVAKAKVIVPAIDDQKEKELDQLERYVKSLEHEAKAMGVNKIAAIALSDSYLKLSGASKDRADKAIALMAKKEGVAEENKRMEDLKKTMESMLPSIMPVTAAAEKYEKAIKDINQALKDNIISEKRAAEMRAGATANMTPGGQATLKFEEDKKAYAKSLHPEDEALKKLKMLNQLMKEGQITSKAFAREQEQLMRSLSSNFDLLATSVETAAQSMTSALVNFAITGKASFRDMTNQMMQDLARMMANKAMTALLDFAVGAMMTAWGSSSSQADINEANSWSMDGSGNWSSSMPKKAAGGPVTGGMPYIVGEKRPEIFVPSSSGTIIPSVGGAGIGSLTISVTVNADGSSDTKTNGNDSADHKMIGEALAFKIKQTIQQEMTPGGDIYSFVKR